MSDLTNILYILLLLLGCVLVAYAIFTLKRLLTTVDTLRSDIHDIKEELIPAMKNISTLSEQARITLEDFEPHRQEVGRAIGSISRFMENVVRIQEIIVDRIEPSLSELGSILVGVTKGLRTFSAAWKKREPFGITAPREDE